MLGLQLTPAGRGAYIVVAINHLIPHFFFFDPLRFGLFESFSSAGPLTAPGSSAGRFFALLAAAFARSLAISSANFSLMFLLSLCNI